MSDGNLSETATHLLAALGYSSNLRLDEQTGKVTDFVNDFKAKNHDTRSERDFCEIVKEVHILFQFTDNEIAATVQHNSLNAKVFDAGNVRSFLFVAVELKKNSYARDRYVSLTREINKRLKIPAVVIFRTSDGQVTLAFVRLRPSKTRADNQVLGSVSLIREININKPHRAHLDILKKLSLPKLLKWMSKRDKPYNFDGLLSAWLAALDTKELNRHFYRDLFQWFERAVKTAKFPEKETKTISAEEHVIRLITRMMFIWFIKEKGLVSDELFIENKIRKLLKDYDRIYGDSYYRVVLQNLFFATLNTEIKCRGFNTNNPSNGNFSCYRYRKEMSEPAALLNLFNKTPFINGGLFDCLDNFEDMERGYHIDCFSDVHYSKLSVPNSLFFSQYTYGGGVNLGLVDLFNRYKFTVEENTPVDQEVALDPELLGKVFENLLAALNQETRKDTRKRTGSYYTPRAVVDYMVDEALVGALAGRVSPKDDDTLYSLQKRLHILLDYASDNAENLFNFAEREKIVRAIASIKILDPAVGSGAFPMGILHKLTLALRRLDPKNSVWKQLQRENSSQRVSSSIFDTDNQQERDAELAEIGDIFEHYRTPDFGRKLYLIQNSIYGADIQPIATQIVKLRFFISLAIEQQPTTDADDNYGIKPLPNLETQFVAANTLRYLDKPRQPILPSKNVTKLEQKLAANRQRYFHANTSEVKLECRKHDVELRRQLADKLQEIVGLSSISAEQISNWAPFEQNIAADWFDAKYMFGVGDGFDVVISNPPYINVENLSEEMRNYLLTNYQTCEKRTDAYIAFLEKGLSLQKSTGILCYIIPVAFTKQDYATKMRKTLIDNHQIRELVDASTYRIFENATVYNIVLSVSRRKSDTLTKVRHHLSNEDFENRTGNEFTIDQEFFTLLKDARFDTNPPDNISLQIQKKVWRKAVRLDQICLVAYGARLNHHTEGKQFPKSYYISTTYTEGAKQFCEGKNIERYSFSQKGWLNYSPDEHYNPMFPELFENDKLMGICVAKDRLRFAYDDKGFYNNHSVINCVRLNLLVNAKHKTAVKAVKRTNLYHSKQFDYRFLLAVLNSRFINWYFIKFLSRGLTFYPKDAMQLPIPNVDGTEQHPIVRLVDRILQAKDSNSVADTSEYEAKIDRLVYSIYGLNKTEIKVVSEEAELSKKCI